MVINLVLHLTPHFLPLSENNTVVPWRLTETLEGLLSAGGYLYMSF
jgi:hypothetical protein